MVYESLQFLSYPAIGITLTVVFVIQALTNVVFTTFIAYEQITLLYQEWRYKEESMRVERYLAIKDRPLSGLFLEESQVKVELTYPRDMRKGKIVIMVLLLSLNTIICMIPYPTTNIVVTLVGAFTSPLFQFIVPGYLYYDQLKKSGTSHIH